jgi:phytoene dehydrogenase-like protein
VRFSFEAGATLFSGLGDGGIFSRALRGRMPATSLLGPVIELRAGPVTLPIPSSRDALIEAVAALPGAPAAGVRAYFRTQAAVADSLWPLFDDVELLPPLSARAFFRHVARSPRYLPLARVVGRPLRAVLADHGVLDFAPLRALAGGLAQITVQAGVADAEAPFALAAADYPFRGTGHVQGGVGQLARAFVAAIDDAGGTVHLARRARAVEPRSGGGFVVQTVRGPLEAGAVVFNLLPRDAARLAGVPLAGPSERLQRRVDEGWGAVMLYLVVEDSNLPAGAHHVEIIDDDAYAGRTDLVEGHHVFVSVSGRDDGHAPPGLRCVTVSTHVALARLRAGSTEEVGTIVHAIQQRMAALVADRAPELRVRHRLTASPRTWARFVGRTEGAVGGPPRRVGLGNYIDAGPLSLSSNDDELWLVGDTAFPGQSTLATVVGGERLGRHLLARTGGMREANAPAADAVV